MIALILSLGLFLNSLSMPSAVEDKTWYVWLDTAAVVDGKEVRIVGESYFTITCCVKSGKFSRLEKSAEKWVKSNYDPSFEKSDVLKKIEDGDLAREVITQAHQDAENSDTILLVNYSDSCK